jgi:hypothetical protein
MSQTVAATPVPGFGPVRSLTPRQWRPSTRLRVVEVATTQDPSVVPTATIFVWRAAMVVAIQPIGWIAVGRTGGPAARNGGKEMHVTGHREQSAHLPPRWFIRLFWAVERAAYSVTRGRFGLQTATADRQGMLRLRTVGRRTGEERMVILGYFEDGADLVTMVYSPSPKASRVRAASR